MESRNHSSLGLGSEMDILHGNNCYLEFLRIFAVAVPFRVVRRRRPSSVAERVALALVLIIIFLPIGI